MKTKKRIIRHIHGLSDDTSINEMEKVLVDVQNYFTDYKHLHSSTDVVNVH